MALKAKAVGSMKSMKKSLASGGDATYFKRVPKEGGLMVRFLEEPTAWVEYSSHFDAAEKTSYPCGDNCVGCASDNKETRRASKRYLTVVVERDENRVVVMELPKTLVASLMKRYDKYHTILDRDYELLRDGEGLNTTYDSIPEPPKKIKMEKYEKELDNIDIMSMLESQYEASQKGASDDDDDDDDDEPRRPRRDKSASRPGKRRVKEEEEPPWDDDDEDDEDEDFTPRRKKPASKKPASKKSAKPVVKSAPKAMKKKKR